LEFDSAGFLDEHSAACKAGIVVHEVQGRGVFDKNDFVSFKPAFSEARA